MNKKEKFNKTGEDRFANIHALSHDGRGVAIISNKTTFIADALPNEIVSYRIIRKHAHYDEAETIAIIQSSVERTSPPCSHFGICGGCSLQHLSTATQLALKQQTLLDQLKHIGRVVPKNIMPALSADTTGYRRKARLGVKFVIKKNKLLVGFREKSSRYLADIEQCIILYPQVGRYLPELRKLVASLEIYQSIPQIEVAVGDKDVALVFRHLTLLSSADKEKLLIFGEKYHFHIYLQPNPPAPIEKIWPQDDKQYLTYTLPDQGIELLFHPLDFTQINLDANRLMVHKAIELLELNTDDTVLDLFCGIGNFTLPIARHVKHVTGIEGSLMMVERAQKNAIHNHIQNVDFYVANLEKPPGQATWLNKKYDKILIDPPRVGAKEILMYCKQFLAKQLVYISCHSATLARDAELLVHQLGYHLKRVGMINMFPHTSHIETIAVFEQPSKESHERY
ncbi:MAG TPA: 23S rRNA (uracil(1939)-C(5))-methyltransferase RlmD [Gammaproteobacteria bacterium]|nr:23S rRNA (uracil(1939)-C(5))-methyltransferase RlmD [Gammaproteobacteria bacterium]